MRWALRQRRTGVKPNKQTGGLGRLARFSRMLIIEHIGIYEIKDLPLQKKAIGDEKNYYLGITRADRTKKLAFHTIALLIDLLSGTITTADNEVAVTVRRGRPGDLHWHLFKRPDDKQVLFVYDKQASPT